MKEDSDKVGIKLNMQKTKIMVIGPITSWEIDGETVEIVTAFILGGSKITVNGECSHEIKGPCSLGKSYDRLRQHLKKQRLFTLPTKVHLITAMVFPVVGTDMRVGV